MCKYKKLNDILPDRRVAYLGSCGFQYREIEGYEFDDCKNSSGEQGYSIPSNRLNKPKGSCMKCKEPIDL